MRGIVKRADERTPLRQFTGTYSKLDLLVTYEVTALPATAYNSEEMENSIRFPTILSCNPQDVRAASRLSCRRW